MENTKIIQILNSKIKPEQKLHFGSVNFLTGRSGSGKTTLLKNINQNTENTALIWQNPINIINPFTKVYQQLEDVCFYNKTDINRISEMVKLDSIEGFQNKKLAQLSGGQQQRYMTAFGLAANSQIILADELTANLDFEASIEIINLLKNIAKESKKTFIIATHDLELITQNDNVLEIKW